VTSSPLRRGQPAEAKMRRATAQGAVCGYPGRRARRRPRLELSSTWLRCRRSVL